MFWLNWNLRHGIMSDSCFGCLWRSDWLDWLNAWLVVAIKTLIELITKIDFDWTVERETERRTNHLELLCDRERCNGLTGTFFDQMFLHFTLLCFDGISRTQDMKLILVFSLDMPGEMTEMAEWLVAMRTQVRPLTEMDSWDKFVEQFLHLKGFGCVSRELRGWTSAWAPPCEPGAGGPRRPGSRRRSPSPPW